MSTAASGPQICVIIPTYNRQVLLEQALQSLVAQTLPREQFEVVVVSDGSPDDTAGLCQRMATTLPLRHYRIKKSGTSSAKNLAIFTSTAPILYFFDDDDVADANLLKEHVAMHAKYPDERIAVLGYTTWAPTLTVTELMHYVMNVGHLLFSYSHLKHEQFIPFHHFWAGRTSCKRSFLVRYGIFKQNLVVLEDVELGYRLGKHGLQIVFNKNAVQYMNRPLTFDQFCQRCEKYGPGQTTFSELHQDSAVHTYFKETGCDPDAAIATWRQEQPHFEAKISRVREIEKQLAGGVTEAEREALRQELWPLYGSVFYLCKIKGLVQALDQQRPAVASPTAPTPAPASVLAGA
jgi:cellulose synthase/poly-beta-1,6-N-acetylglucosamine synthase-like glycosyltransferase